MDCIEDFAPTTIILLNIWCHTVLQEGVIDFHLEMLLFMFKLTITHPSSQKTYWVSDLKLLSMSLSGFLESG